MDAAWRGGFGCAPVCLDLCVGRSPVREPSPVTARHELLDRLTGCGGGDSTMMTNEEKILEAKVTQMSEENRRLTEMITRLYGTQIARHGIDITGSPSPPPRPMSPSPTTGNKRGRESMETANSCDANNNNNQKITGGDAESFGVEDGTACRRIKVSRVCRRIDPSDNTLVVKDGYQWRKYGQKVTRDNPSPRAYFRCAFAPSCPVKKKVQRSADDSSVLVATYEGEHNHHHPSPRAGDLPAAAGINGGSLPCSISINSSGPTITLDLTKNGGAVQAAAAADMKEVCREVASPEFRSALVEQMASALTSDPKFTGALAAAILQKLPEF